MSNIYNDGSERTYKKRRKRPKYNPLRIIVFGGGGVLAALLIIFLFTKFFLQPGSDQTALKDTETEYQIAETETEESTEVVVDAQALAAAKESLEADVQTITIDKEAIAKEKTDNMVKEYTVTDGIKAYAADETVKIVTVEQSDSSLFTQTLYYRDDALIYADLKNDDSEQYAFYVKDGNLIRVAKSAAGSDASETKNLDNLAVYLPEYAEQLAPEYEDWCNEIVTNAAAYFTTAKTAVETSIKEAQAAAAEKADVAKSTASSSSSSSSKESSSSSSSSKASSSSSSSSKTSSSSSSSSKTSSSGSSSSKTSSSGSSSSKTSSSSSSSSKSSSEKTETKTTAKEIFADSSTRKLTESDIKDLSETKLQTALNEIYARNGYKFKNKKKYNYFCQFSWYKPDTSNEATVKARFNDVEKANYDLITSYQVEKGYRDPSTLK